MDYIVHKYFVVLFDKIDKGSSTDNKTMMNEDEIVGFENYAYKNIVSQNIINL